MDSPAPRILLIFPAPLATIPLGFTYVAKRFKQNGFDVKLHINSFRHFKGPEEMLADVIRPYRPDIVGLSFSTFDVAEVYKLQCLCKDAGYFVLSGGCHPSIRPEEVLGEGADMVARGEGELIIDAFCDWYKRGKRAEEREGIPGASYRSSDGAVKHVPKPPRITDLDGVGEADFSSVDLEDFLVQDGSVKGLNVISCGRGCPFRCSYCSHSDWFAYSKRGADSVIQEMVNRNERYGVTHFWLSDETFSIDKGRVHDFCTRLSSARLRFSWSASTRISNVDERLLRAMKDAGMSQIIYGVESASDETLRRIHKGHNARQALETVELTGKVGIPIFINLMTGFPWETPKHVESNIDFIRATSPYTSGYMVHGAVVPYPDTPLYEEYHEKEGFTDYWLKEKYRHVGLAIYQNVVNPYETTTYFQRNMFDDTYVAEDYFFKYTSEYKKAVVRMGMLIGWKTMEARYRSPWKRRIGFTLGQASQALYRINPNIEKRIVGALAGGNAIHNARLTGGRFVKK